MAEDREDSGEKTETPSRYRLEKAREEGQIPRSQELPSAAVLVVGATLLAVFGARAFDALSTGVRTGIGLAPAVAEGQMSLGAAAWLIVRPGLVIVFGMAGILAIVGFLASGVLGGWTWSWKSALPDFSRVSPASGFKRIFSTDGAIELLKSVLKFVAVGAVVWIVLSSRIDEVIGFGDASWPGAALDIWSLLSHLLIWTSAAVVLLAGAEVPYRIWSFSKSMRMTREEVKEEAKEHEGNPHTKGRIRGVRRRLARARMMAEVPKAGVVITNPTHFAVALTYDESRMGAPQVVAKGTGLIAARIREVAAQHGVAVVSAPRLARVLYRLTEVGDEIPSILYATVAEVLAFVYRLRRAEEVGEERPLAPVSGFEPPEELEGAVFGSTDA